MKRTALALTILVATSGAALAHISLETGEAAVESNYKGILRVPHGCNGAATTKIRVQIPEGVVAVKPMPKSDWTVEVVRAKYAKTYTLYGAEISEGVTEIIWTGNLPDDFYDEFAFRGRLTDQLKVDTVLYFPVIQECGKTTERWIDIPLVNQTEDDLQFPAPGLKLIRGEPMD